MSLQTVISKILDPAGGDDISHPQRRLRLNLRRIELVAVLAILVAVVEAIFSIQRQIDGYLEVCIVCGAGAAVFLVVAHDAQRRPPDHFKHLPEVFVLYALLAAQALSYFIAMAGRIASGYSLVYLACAVFFLIPPRRFALIGAATLAIFIAWVLTSPLTGFDQVNTIFNASLAVGFGMIGRWGLDRLEEVNDDQKRRIAEQNVALQKNNDELNGLMAVAAHDLRSPLFGLGNLLELASTRPPQTPEGWQDVLRAAGNSINSMQTLISRILEAHEAETADKGLRERVDLRMVLEDAIARNRHSAERHGTRFALQACPEPVEALVQADALEQVVDNLISNAIRFSPAGSAIELSARKDGQPSIEIADRGIGIPQAERAALFGKFKRGSARPVNGQWGSGLGHYIVRTLAGAMQAQVRYAPREGGGSAFRIEFSSEK